MADRRERRQRGAADALGGRIGADERGMLALERFELTVKRVVFGVAYRGLI